MTVSVLLAAAISTSTITPAMAASNTAPATGDAHATSQRVAVDPATVVAAIKAAYDIYQKFAGGGLSLQQATQQILAAIQQARDAIIAHIDAIATANVQACAREAVIDFQNFNVLTPDNQQNFALNATSCVTLGDSLLGAVTDKGAIDQLGFALNAVGPITLITRSWVHFSNTGVPETLKHSNQIVFNQLTPTCQAVIEPGNPSGTDWQCTSYNGDFADAPLRKPHDFVIDEAGSRTSWAVAKAVIPLLG